MSDSEKLLNLVRTLSYKEGIFTLKSGRTSDFYVDCRQTSLHPEGAFLIGVEMFRIIKEKFPSAVAVAGVADGAIPIATAVSIQSHLVGTRPLPNIIVRKESKDHGVSVGSRLAGHERLEAGAEVVLVEDVATTGGSSISAADAIEAEGFEVVGILVLVDRQEGAQEAIENAGYDFASVFTRNDVMC